MEHHNESEDTTQESSTASLPVVALIPNMMTILALCAGLSSIRFALNERWELATTFILVASILDGADGRFARML
ncbi:MAG: CDP-alcohol phosphatidyltransferase family protein, partial [Rickettsiales bacterium]|nr:CDP-alcohol phosphatidyltransferase family protein [Rickettsiales bacterium]